MRQQRRAATRKTQKAGKKAHSATGRSNKSHRHGLPQGQIPNNEMKAGTVSVLPNDRINQKSRWDGTDKSR